MKTFYIASFWILLAFFAGTGIAAYRSASMVPVKDMGLPLAALFFTAGQLYLGEKQHDQQRKDQYWDKRLNYFVRLRKLIGIICYEFSEQDIKEVTPADGSMPEFKNTKLGKIYWDLMELEFEGDVLFANIGEHLAEVRKQFEIVHKKGIALINSTADSPDPSRINEEQFKKRMATIQEQQAAKAKIEKAFTECKTIVSYYLRQK